MMNISKLRRKVTEAKAVKLDINKRIDKITASITSKTTTLHLQEQAREIIRQVGLETQQQLQFHISDISSLALEAVFDDPYELSVEFVERRNKSECDLMFRRDAQLLNPLDSSGYGAADVASFALRIASWSMQNPKSRNVIIMDEPFRFLSKDRQEFASQMVKEVSEKLGIQFIIVTHEDILTQYADRVFKVSKKKEISIVE